MSARILVVDDEPLNLAVLSRLLNPVYRVLATRSGASAVTLAANLQYKVVRASSTADIDTLTEINNGNGTLVMSYSAGATSTIVTGLTANTSYAFAVVVKDEAGNEALYSPITKTTLASDTANPTVTGLSISTIAHPTSIDLSWGAATDDGTPPAYLLYRVYMTSGASNTIGTPADAQTNGTAVTDWTVGMTSATADGLSMGTNYAFAVLVKDGSGITTLTGANAYTGGTTVKSGILQGNTSSLVGNIASEVASAP